MSYSPPSGLTSGMIQISRLFDDARDPRRPWRSRRCSWCSRYSAISTVRCSRACWWRVEQDLGLVLVDADVVADLGRPEVAPLVALADAEHADDARVRLATAWISATISA